MNELHYQLDLMRAMNQNLATSSAVIQPLPWLDSIESEIKRQGENVPPFVRYHGLCLYLLFF